MTPDEICQEYRNQLRRLYGDEYVDRSRINYSQGWYYIKYSSPL